MDGVYLKSSRNINNSIVVTAGSRVDFLVKCKIAGDTILQAYQVVYMSNMIHGSKTMYEIVLFPQMLASVVVGSIKENKKSVLSINDHDYDAILRKLQKYGSPESTHKSDHIGSCTI